MSSFFYDPEKIMFIVRGRIVYDLLTGNRVGQINDSVLTVDNTDHSEQLMLNISINRYSKFSAKRNPFEEMVTNLEANKKEEE